MPSQHTDELRSERDAYRKALEEAHKQIVSFLDVFDKDLAAGMLCIMKTHDALSKALGKEAQDG